MIMQDIITAKGKHNLCYHNKNKVSSKTIVNDTQVSPKDKRSTMDRKGEKWNREETILVFKRYFSTPFSKTS